jgi:hypothetical protein
MIKVGALKFKSILINDIRSVERSYDLIASPANALKRLKLNYREDYIFISARHKKEFISKLKSINPNIQIYKLEKTIKFQPAP